MNVDSPQGLGDTISDDVVLKTIDDQKLSVSRRLLAAESGYFRALFNGNYHDSRRPIYRVPFTSDLMTDLLGGIQKDQVRELPIWSLSKSYDLLSPVTYFQIDRLLPHLQKSITTQIDVNSLIKYYHYAMQHDQTLSEQLWELLVKHFNKLIDGEQYVKMTQEELLRAMFNEKLNIESRIETVILGNYIAKNPGKCHKVRQQLDNNLRHTGDGVGHPVVMNRVPKDVLLCYGGWSNGPADIVEVYNPRNEKWIQVDFMQNDRRAYHTLARQGNRLYVTGGMDGRVYHRSVKYYDMDAKEWVTTVPDMSERRCYSASITIPFTDGSSQLMILGGYSGVTRLSSCELVNPQLMGWRYVKPMLKPRSDAAVALVNDGVVCIGGFDGRNIHQDTEMYNVDKNIWLPLNRRMLNARTGTSAVALNPFTFLVAGGFNGHTRLAMVEFYDTREGRWHALPQMHTTRSNFGMDVINGEVYVVGGFDGTGVTNLAEKFDMTARLWTKLPEISTARSALKSIRLSDHEIIRELVGFCKEE